MGTGAPWVGPTTHRPHVGLAMVEGLRRRLLLVVLLWESSLKTLVFESFSFFSDYCFGPSKQIVRKQFIEQKVKTKVVHLPG